MHTQNAHTFEGIGNFNISKKIIFQRHYRKHTFKFETKIYKHFHKIITNKYWVIYTEKNTKKKNLCEEELFDVVKSK